MKTLQCLLLVCLGTLATQANGRAYRIGNPIESGATASDSINGLDATGPQGPQGERGPPGPPGPSSPSGPPGPSASDDPTASTKDDYDWIYITQGMYTAHLTKICYDYISSWSGYCLLPSSASPAPLPSSCTLAVIKRRTTRHKINGDTNSEKLGKMLLFFSMEKVK